MNKRRDKPETREDALTGRETRILPVTIEFRETTGSDGRTVRTIVGTIRYNSESSVMTDWYGDKFVEEIAAGAFDRSLREMPVVGLWCHRTDQVIGNTKAGTLRTQSDMNGLHFECDLPNNTVGNDAWESVQRRDVDGVSFGFNSQKDAWARIERNGETIYKRTVLDADLFEISPTPFAAYPENEVSVRSLDEFREGVKAREAEERKRKLALELELL
jgi:HK97 family phage prohead protease